jgi:hypothetical protein
MSEKFQISRNEGGVEIFIQSPKIEQLFRNMAHENRTRLALAGIEFEGWHSEQTDKFMRQITEMFTNQVAAVSRGRSNLKEEELIIPTFRNNALFSNNGVGVMLLLARGIGEKGGKKFQIPGMYSIETTKKIALGFQKAMYYIVNESAKTVTYAFDVVEVKGKKEESGVLEFPA